MTRFLSAATVAIALSLVIVAGAMTSAEAFPRPNGSSVSGLDLGSGR